MFIPHIDKLKKVSVDKGNEDKLQSIYVKQISKQHSLSFKLSNQLSKKDTLFFAVV